MTTTFRLAAASCSLAFALSPLTGAETASSSPPTVVIERAPEPGQIELERQLAEARAETRRLQADLAAALSSKAQDDATLKESARELASLRATIARLETAPKPPEPNSVELQKQIESLESIANSLTAKNQELEAALGRRSSELQEAQDRVAELAARRSAATNAAAQLAAEKDRADEATKQVAALQTEVDRLRAEKTDFDAQLSSARGNEAALREQLAGATATQREPAADLTARVAELEARLAQTEGKLATALHSYSLLQTENDRLKTTGVDQSAATAERDDLRRQIADLETRLAAAPTPPDLSEQLAKTEDKLNTVLRSYSLLEQETEKFKAQAARAAEQTQTNASRAAGESAAQISALFDELRQTQAQSASLAAENSQLKTRLAIVGPSPGSTLSTPARPGATTPLASTPTPPEPAPTEPRLHTVAPGDNLAKISRTYYGTASRWDEILDANRDVIENENVLPIGATLRIP